LQLKSKEEILYEQEVRFNASSVSSIYTIQAQNTILPNGGIMSVNLYKISNDYNNIRESNGKISTGTVMSWL